VTRRSRAGAWILALVVPLLSCAPEHDPASHLTIWADMEPREQELLNQHIAVFETERPGITIEATYLDTRDVRNQFQTAALAKAGPDLVYGPSDQVGPFSIMGLIEPLEDVVSADTLAIFDDSAKPSLEGHVYALADQVGNHLTLVFNRAFVDHPPADTDEWIAMAKANTVDENGDGRIDRYGIVMNLLEPFWLVPWLGAYGGWVMDERTLEPTLDTEAMRQALRFFQRLLAAGVIPPGCDYQLADTLFKEGSAAFLVNGPWSWTSYTEAGIDVGLGVLPRVDGEDSYPTPMTACKAYSLNRYVPDVRRTQVLDLLHFLVSARCVGEISLGLGALPSRIDVEQWPAIVADPTVQASLDQLRKGRLMPVVPEMRVIWDVMRPAFQQVLSGDLDVDTAARRMQTQAVRKIEELHL
jgi:maltose-binding protein MalE